MKKCVLIIGVLFLTVGIVASAHTKLAFDAPPNPYGATTVAFEAPPNPYGAIATTAG